MPVPPHLHALLDDASAARSTEAGLEAAVLAHRRHRREWYGERVGPLVVRDTTLPRLGQLPGATSAGALEVVVAVSGGAGALAPAVRWTTREESLALRGLQVTMRESDAGDLAPNARRVVAAVEALVDAGALDEDVAVYVEPPPLSGLEPTASWLSALDELATMDHRLTLRAHGTVDGEPSIRQLAAGIDAALDRELRFRCTGLHRALPHADPDTGAARPGVVNVLLATRAGLDGASTADMATVLEETDATVLSAATDVAGLASAHRWFISCDTDGVAGSLHDLLDLGWLGRP